MGANSTKFVYSMPFTYNTSKNETEIFRSPQNSGAFLTKLDDNDNLQSILLSSIKKYGKKSFLGSRNKDGAFCFNSYEECYEKAKKIGSYILKNKLFNEVYDSFNKITLKLVGVYSKNREQWLLVDLACILFGFTLVPIYETLGLHSILKIFEETKITTLFCSFSKAQNLNENSPKLIKNYIVFDDFPSNLPFINFEKILEEIFDEFELPKIAPKDVYTISYTSGSDGEAKGVLITHENMVSAIVAAMATELQWGTTDFHLSYLPLAHIYERLLVNCCMTKGAAIGFYSGDVSKLIMDLEDLKPTYFASVPRLYNKFVQKMESSKKKSSLVSTLFHNKRKKFFGGRTKFLLTASAPITEQTLFLLQELCDCPIYQAYGLTESTGLSFITSQNDEFFGSIGGPIINIEFKIRDVSEMGYTIKGDSIQGELLLRGPTITKGYFNDEESTRKTIDENGWLITGDIVEFDINNGSLKVIDRKKDIFKLAQGEYISPNKVENVYLQSPLIQDIIVYGDSFQSFLIGFIVCKKEKILELCESKLKLKVINYQEIIKDKCVIEAIFEEINICGKEGGLNGFEMIKKIIIIDESDEKKEEIFSSSMKLRRKEIKKIFENEIKQIYQEFI